MRQLTAIRHLQVFAGEVTINALEGTGGSEVTAAECNLSRVSSSMEIQEFSHSKRESSRAKGASVSRNILQATIAKQTVAGLLAVCSVGSCLAAGVLDPQGPVGSAERLILLNGTAIMLVVVVPVIVLTLVFAWWYRASNKRAAYSPEWSYSGRTEFVVWSKPVMVLILLAGVAWTGSHELDPARKLASEARPIRVEVVSLDWKWLFIYPDQHIATVNQLIVPVGTPIEFMLTSAAAMASRICASW
jgi:hypothetical protein